MPRSALGSKSLQQCWIWEQVRDYYTIPTGQMELFDVSSLDHRSGLLQGLLYHIAICALQKLTVYLYLLGIRGEASQDGALPLTWSADCELAADDYTAIAHCSCQDTPQNTGYEDALRGCSYNTHRHVHRRREMNIVRLILNLLKIKGMRLCHVSWTEWVPRWNRTSSATRLTAAQYGLILGPLYTRSQSQKKLGANFEHFWVANWPSQIWWDPFFSLGGQYKAIKFSIY
jgi:hypothetical protein